MHPRKRGLWYSIKWLLTLTSFCVLIIVAILVWADRECRKSVDTWIPLYPNAEQVSVEYNLVRPRAYGTSTMVLSSPDDAETIRQFYRDNTLAIMHENTPRGLAITDWHVEENPDADGSLIYLFSTCGE